MKRQIFARFIVLAFAVCTGLLACKSTPAAKSSENSVSVTLEISTSDVLNQLLRYEEADPSYLKAFSMAIEKQTTDTTKHFVDLFADAWNEVEPSGRLSRIFSTYELRDQVSPESANEEVIRVLRSECDMAMANTMHVLRARIDRYGVTGVEARRIGLSDKVELEVTGVENPKRLFNLLTIQGRLGFWETYGNVSWDDVSIFDMMVKANDVIRQLNGVETLEDAGDLTVEEYNEQNPLFAILQSSVDPNGQPYQSACIGIASASDTARVNELLRIPEVRIIFPLDLRFLWSLKSIGMEEGSYLDLVAIKANTRDGRAPVDGDVIVDAKLEQNKRSGSWEVLVAMNAEGSRTWAQMTADNVGRSIAIVIDDRVYSYPMVNGEITGGQSMITGNFTQEDAEEMVIMLKSGRLPVPVKILDKTAEEKNDTM